jgi:hypothetical protein
MPYTVTGFFIAFFIAHLHKRLEAFSKAFQHRSKSPNLQLNLRSGVSISGVWFCNSLCPAPSIGGSHG